MKLWFKRGQKGFTLVELMVVMGILAVLASIVFPAVSGTSEVAGDSQTKQDASTVNGAVNDYYADQTGAEVVTTNTTSILGRTYTASTYTASSYTASSFTGPDSGNYTASSYTASSYTPSSYTAGTYTASSYTASSYTASSYTGSNSGNYTASSYTASSYTASSYTAGTSVTQVITTRWPEKYLTATYLAEFPLAIANTGQAVSGNVTITTAALNGTTANITPKQLAEGWNAIDLDKLATTYYIQEVPKSATDLSGNFHNYLWLLKKTSAAAQSGTVESRAVTVFKLSKVEQNETSKNYTLYYEQIY